MRKTHSWYRIYEYCFGRRRAATEPRFERLWRYLEAEAYTAMMSESP